MENKPTDTPVLELKNIVKSFGTTKALDNASLRIFPGEVHALMGGNGAGKSTIIGIIAGARMPDSGTIVLDGAEVNFRSPIEPLRKGIAVVYQELSILPHLTVAENIAGSNIGTRRNGLFKWKEACRIAERALKTLGEACSEIDPLEIVSNLRADQMQMVEIARAVSMDAKIILLDEPTSSLNFDETKSLFKIIRVLKSHGISFLFVSHRMNEVREISDRVTVFRDGKLVLDGALMNQKSDADIVKCMLGHSLVIDTERNSMKFNENEKKPVVLNISFKKTGHEIAVHEGEIIGLAGLAGSGRSSLLKNIWGVKKWTDVGFELYGQEHRPTNSRQSIRNDMAYIGEDRKLTGLFLDLPITETTMMPLRTYKSKKIINNKEERLKVSEIIGKLKVKIPSVDHSPRSLSGGNQQKLLFGKWLINAPKVFLLDEPTRGVDINTKQEIYKLISDMADQGSSIIVVSSEIMEMVLLCHKVIVMKNGIPDVILTGDDINEAHIMSIITSAETDHIGSEV